MHYQSKLPMGQADAGGALPGINMLISTVMGIKVRMSVFWKCIQDDKYRTLLIMMDEVEVSGQVGKC